MRLWVSFLVFLIAAPVVAEEVSCGPNGPWHDPAMEYHLDDLLALIEARLDWEEGKPREDDPGDLEKVAAAVAAWQRLAEPHDGRSGNPEARWWLGHLMMEGKAGFAADAWGALAFLLPAAEAGHLEAMTQAGRILVRDENAERLTPDASALPAPAKGRACLKRAAWLGNREAQVRWHREIRPGRAIPTPALLASAITARPLWLHNLVAELQNDPALHDLLERALVHCAECGNRFCQYDLGKYMVDDQDLSSERSIRGMAWIAIAAEYGSHMEAILDIIKYDPSFYFGGMAEEAKKIKLIMFQYKSKECAP